MKYEITGCPKCDKTNYSVVDSQNFKCDACSADFTEPKIVRTLSVLNYMDLIRISLKNVDDFHTTKLYGSDYPLDSESTLINFRELPIYSLEGDIYKKLLLNAKTLKYEEKILQRRKVS